MAHWYHAQACLNSVQRQEDQAHRTRATLRFQRFALEAIRRHSIATGEDLSEFHKVDAVDTHVIKAREKAGWTPVHA